MSTARIADPEVDQTRSDGVDFLGLLAWYTVNDVKVQHQVLVHALMASGLEGFVPPQPADADVFRRSCKAAVRRRFPEGVDYRFPATPADGRGVIRYLVRRTGTGGTTREETVSTLTYHKASRAIETTLPTPWDAITAEVIEDVKANFEADRGTLDSHSVRELLRRILLQAGGAINVRGDSGGVYFLPNSSAGILDSLECLADLLGGAVTVHGLPLVDSAKQRDMLRRAYEVETANEVETLIGQIRALLEAGRPLGAARIRRFRGQLTILARKAATYSALIGGELDAADAAVAICERQIMALAALCEK